VNEKTIQPVFNLLAYDMTVQLVHKTTGERSEPLSGTPPFLVSLLQRAFSAEGANPDDHCVLVLTQEVPKDGSTVIICSRLPIVELPKFIQFVAEHDDSVKDQISSDEVQANV